MADKVSTIFEGLTVPLSLTTYNHRGKNMRFLRTHIEELFGIAAKSIPAEARQKALELFDRVLSEQMQDNLNDII